MLQHRPRARPYLEPSVEAHRRALDVASVHQECQELRPDVGHVGFCPVVGRKLAAVEVMCHVRIDSSEEVVGVIRGLHELMSAFCPRSVVGGASPWTSVTVAELDGFGSHVRQSRHCQGVVHIVVAAMRRIEPSGATHVLEEPSTGWPANGALVKDAVQDIALDRPQAFQARLASRSAQAASSQTAS